MRIKAGNSLSQEARVLDLGTGFSLVDNSGDVQVSLGGFIAVPDYLVYPDGSTYKARAVGSGVAAYSGSSSISAFQAAIDALTVSGGTVGMKGLHTWDESAGIIVPPGVSIVSDGPQSAGLGQDQPGAVIQATSTLDGPIITVEVTDDVSSRGSYGLLRGFTIIGDHTATSQDGVYVTDGSGTMLDFYMENVLVFDVGHDSFVCDATSVKAWLTKCYLENAQRNAMTVSGGQIRAQYMLLKCLGLGFDATSTAFFGLYQSYVDLCVSGGGKLLSNSTGFEIASNRFADNGSSTAPTLIVNAGGPTGGTSIHHNSFADSRGTGNVVNHISGATSGSMKCRITNNDFKGMSGDAITVKGATANYGAIRHNTGYNDVKGKLASPFGTTANFVGPISTNNTATPTASTAYQANLTDIYLVVSGGTGVSITIKNGAGDTIQSGLSTFAGVLPFGWTINFGAFTVAPTIIASII